MTSSSVKPQFKSSLTLALVFQIGWIVACVIASLLGVTINVGLLVFLLLTLWVLPAVELVTRIQLPFALRVHYCMFITAASVAGSLLGVYGFIPHWDKLVHLYSGILLAWLGLFAVRIVEEKVDVRIPRWFVVSAALVTPLACAALWEIGEFLSDTFLHTTTQAGLEDTIVDMAAAAVGAVIAVTVVVWIRMPKTVLSRAIKSDAQDAAHR